VALRCEGVGFGVIIFIEVKEEYNFDEEKIKLLHVFFNVGTVL